MCIFIFYIRSATAASHYYGNLRTWVQRLQADFILTHVWGLKILNLFSFHAKTLSCPQTTSEGLKCLTAILLGVYIYFNYYYRTNIFFLKPSFSLKDQEVHHQPAEEQNLFLS